MMKKLFVLFVMASLILPMGLAGTGNLVWDKIIIQNGGGQAAEKISIYDSSGNLLDFTTADNAIFWMERTAGASKVYTVKSEATGWTPYTENIQVSGNSYQEVYVWYTINQKAQDLPAKPALSGTAVSDTQVDLSWSYSGPAIDGFRVLRDGSEIANVNASTTTYSDTGLTASTTYKYIVRAYNSAGDTDSDEISVTTKAPTTGETVYVRDLDFKTKVSPGDSIDFKLQLKNNASYDAEDVTATIVVKDLNDGEDVEADGDFGAIDSGDKETKTISIDIPASADDKKYTVEVELEWFDDSKAYSSVYTAGDKLEVVKEEHSIQITSVQASKTSYEPGESVQLAISLLNNGANDENVQLKASSDIGVTVTGAQFELKEGDSTTQYLSFAIPEDTRAAKYFVVASAVYGSSSASKSIILEVAEEEQQGTQITVVQPTPEEPAGAPVGATQVALGLVAVILAALIIWLGKDLVGTRSQIPVTRRPVARRGRR